jgi:2'-5' RNA ligase
VVQSVELLLDPHLDGAVRRQWQALADAGLPGLAGHRSPSNRPHVTLAVSREHWPDDVEATLAEVITMARDDGTLPIDVRLGGYVVFAHRTRHVLGRLVVPSPALLGLQARLAGATRAAGPGVPHTEPGRWTPHVTLARSLAGEQFPAALAALGAAGGTADLAGSGVGVRRWDGDARREWPLG